MQMVNATLSITDSSLSTDNTLSVCKKYNYYSNDFCSIILPAGVIGAKYILYINLQHPHSNNKIRASSFFSFTGYCSMKNCMATTLLHMHF